jgi:hypothetical protein
MNSVRAADLPEIIKAISLLNHSETANFRSCGAPLSALCGNNQRRRFSTESWAEVSHSRHVATNRGQR